MIKKLDHVGIAVADIAAHLALFEALGVAPRDSEEVPEQRVRTTFVEIGGVDVELLEPTSDDSPVARFLAKRGPGVHHICYEVDDIEAALAELARRGYRLVDAVPRTGAHGKRIAFLHPSAADGVLVELSETPRPPREKGH